LIEIAMMKVLRLAALLTTIVALPGCSDDTTAPAPVTYIATLNGANERPNANQSTATGTGTYVLSGNTLSYTVVVTGLTTPASASHLHIGGAAGTGPVLVPYTTASVTSGQITSGTIDLSQPIVSGSITITGDSLRALLNNGNAYTNVHNSTFPGGEVRGQIVRRN
jgi:hypothetical protein